MPARRRTVRITANFEVNLAAIESFLAEADAAHAFAALLEELASSIVPNLERYPDMGRPFLDRPPQSIEAREKVKRLESLVGSATLREYIAGDYLMLYAVREQTVYLLSIKHHRQLSFDFPAHWR